ncbi:hypothetical protein MY11210_000429 [Beauveria gryllotalpidicola]
MKYAIIFTSAAALVGATPYMYYQPTTVEANNQPKLANATEAAAKKLPFFEPIFSGIYCREWRVTNTWNGWSNENCGTKAFCQAFDDEQKIRKIFEEVEPPFKNAKDCFDAHDPEPAVEDQPKPAIATEAIATEAVATEAVAKKLPFLEAAFSGIYCREWRVTNTWFGWSNQNCGTKAFCQAFDDEQKIRKIFEEVEPPFKNAKDCFDAHDLEPAVKAN